MKTIIHIIRTLLLAVSLLAGGCVVIKGSGQVKSEDREIRHFNAVDLSGSGELLLSPGTAESLRVEAEDNILPLITTEVVGETLRIGFKSTPATIVQPTKPIRYHLAFKNLSAIQISGSGAVTSSSLTAERLTFDVSGSGSAQMEALQVKALVIRVSGSGNFKLAGQATRQDVKISGSGKYDAPLLISKEARIDISGSGSATLRAEESLDVQISGSGSVSYHGKPAIRQHLSGSGQIHGLDQ